CGVGLGAIALGQLLAESGFAAPPAAGSAALADALAPRKAHHAARAKNGILPERAARGKPHHAARAKKVIFLFMAGAPSHLELFDYKPQLAKFNGTLPPPDLVKGYRAAFINPSSKLLGPKFKFAKHGRSQAELSELLPFLAGVADDIAIVK